MGNVSGKYWGYILNSNEQHNSFKEALTGSSFDLLGRSRFSHISCSVNFIECHDNHTLYDKVNILRPDISEKEKLLRVSFANEIVLYSLGIPFFHAGQEIGLSKKGEGNTYNAGDSLNQFKYSLLKELSLFT